MGQRGSGDVNPYRPVQGSPFSGRRTQGYPGPEQDNREYDGANCGLWGTVVLSPALQPPGMGSHLLHHPRQVLLLFPTDLWDRLRLGDGVVNPRAVGGLPDDICVQLLVAGGSSGSGLIFIVWEDCGCIRTVMNDGNKLICSSDGNKQE